MATLGRNGVVFIAAMLCQDGPHLLMMPVWEILDVDATSAMRLWDDPETACIELRVRQVDPTVQTELSGLTLLKRAFAQSVLVELESGAIMWILEDQAFGERAEVRAVDVLHGA
jgi:hypothetical protein